MTPQDTQGLKSSAITETQNRLQKVVEVFRQLMADIQPALVALQEVHPTLLSELREWATAHNFTLLFTANPNTNSGQEAIDHGVILVNNRHLTLANEPVEIVPFLSDKGTPTKYIKKVSLKSQQQLGFIFSNVHRFYIDKTVLPNFLARNADTPHIVVGDMNLEHTDMDQLLLEHPQYERMTKPTGEFTHIDTKRRLVDYDHVLFTSDIQIQTVPALTEKALKNFSIQKRY